MRGRLSFILLGSFGLCVACGNDDTRSKPLDLDEDRGDAGRAKPPPASTADASTSPQPAPRKDAGQDAGAETDPPDASHAADASAVCGDGVLDRDTEDCDGADFGRNSCRTIGYVEGQLGCSSTCEFDTSACIAGELCHDGRDNDGDMLVDCQDEDCDEACSQSCATPVPIAADGRVINGSTFGHADELSSECALADDSGAELVYEFVPSADGVLQVSLQTSLLLSVSVRDGCVPLGSGAEVGDAGADGGVAPTGETNCAIPDRQLVTPVTADESVYIVVDGRSASVSGDFELTASFREVECGDGHRDADEACDDGNLAPGDGCSDACMVELSELEPNDTTDTASAYSAPFFAEITPAGDRDYIQLELQQDTSELLIATENLGDGACALNLMDPVLSVFDYQGDLLATDDDSGDGFCAVVTMRNIAAGSYLVLVEAAPGSEPTTFPYRLRVTP